MKYKFLEHTADVKFRAYGETLEKAFVNSSEALVHSICQDEIKKSKIKKISIKGKNLENLLYNFLEELIYLFDSEQFILAKIKSLKLNEKELILNAELEGENAKNYEIYSHIKAVTYNEMFIKKEKGFWVCQVVLDV